MQVNYPSHANIVEVGPRDGLQNEASLLHIADKVNLINALSQAGLQHIESGSFVSPKWVPQMANSDQVFANITRKAGVIYSALTPNLKGYEGASAANADTVAVFASASSSFSMKNINCDIPTSIERFTAVIEQAKKDNRPVRGYVSCVLGCPYEGDVSPQAVLDVTKALLDLGCYEVSLGDTIGVGTALKTKKLTDLLISQISINKLALHCHDTYGQALTNVLIGLQQGINTFDSSVGGLGGCPYAAGASGNLASEDLVYMLNNMGIETGVDLQKMAHIGQEISDVLGRKNQSKTGIALYNKVN
ncbi:hydroxymethylglutaryl-CoA lyase [Glaciecola punicea]|uniref:hydroxymethylglutaryl-CoA lyase n=1 Tax=Glaciecola punicea TaxID=56804 RepID=UPI000871FD0F|nr:hydroxymethylglutaryl-CoA lyase [Glaciecola punicea]OFA33179.1 hydroxymethylglutaryl-CoA lyase [Glaciecola punicea]